MYQDCVCKVYYHKYRIVYLITGGIIFGIGLILMQASISEAMMCFITSAFCVYLGQTLCIVTSPMGIAYHNMGVYTLQTSWENVERVDFVSSRGFGKQRYLLLKEPVYLGARSNLTWVLPTDEQRERTIPLPVAPGWERFQELMEDIKHYAPHVVGLP